MSQVGHCCIRVKLYKYTHAQTVYTFSIIINRAERAQSLIIIKHKNILMYYQKIVINIKLCLWKRYRCIPSFGNTTGNILVRFKIFKILLLYLFQKKIPTFAEILAIFLLA